LRHTPEAAVAALHAVRTVEGPVAVEGPSIDSGQELLEVGLAAEAATIRAAIRRRIVEARYRLVLTGTPKEAFGLGEALAGLPVEVRYVGEAVAAAALAERRWLPRIGGEGGVVFHPSESLLHRLNAFDVIDTWLRVWLGERYRREDDPRRTAWPAAIERPAVRVPAELTRRLAEQRLGQLRSLLDPADRAVVLTCDPWSWRALRSVAPPEIEIVDLLVFATRDGQGAPTGG
jgi:hypothetical protein